MQQIPSYLSTKQSRGGRISSPRLRETIEQSQDFEGLEESVKHFDLLTLVKRAGKAANFSAKMIELLEHYMILTRDIDWQAGSQPIVYKSQEQTAMDLDISVRHVRRLEKELFEAGALTWIDSGNHKRYGQRCPETGRILYAYGVDLTPLAYLKDELEAIVHEQQLYKAAWMETKRQISWHRSQIKALLAEMAELGLEGQGAFICDYEAIATRYDTRKSIEAMRSDLAKHKDLYERIIESLETFHSNNKTSKESCKADSNDLHKQDTNQKTFNKLNTGRAKPKCFQGRRNENLEPSTESSQKDAKSPQEEQEDLILKTGLQHISAKQLLNAASERFKSRILVQEQSLRMDDIVEAAYGLRSDLHISQGSWSRACQVLTRYGAAVCLLLVDQATQRDENRVQKPAAYFNSMISLAQAGNLHLHKSVFGLLKAKYSPETAVNSNETSTTQRQGE